MLEKLIRIDNVGVFKAGVPNAVTLKKVTLIYADNARGKSTLSSVLHACSVGAPEPVTNRLTLNSNDPQKVQFRFAWPIGGLTVAFDGKSWDATAPNVHVFNQDFVERNVYAGSEVSPEHRSALLDFALGADAVKQRDEVQKFAVAQEAATKRRTQAEEKLKPYQKGYALANFIALPVCDDPDKQLESLAKRIQEAKQVAFITAKPALRSLLIPTFQFDIFEQVLSSSLEQVQDNAESIVKTHLQVHGGEAAKHWVSTGLQFNPDEFCPFCGQDTQGLELLAAYRTYFNKAYSQHMERIAGLEELVNSFVPGAFIKALEVVLQANADIVAGWAGTLEVKNPPFDLAEVLVEVDTARALLKELALEKSKSPLNTIELEKSDATKKLLNSVVTRISEYNEFVNKANEDIATFKKNLAGEDVAKLEQERSRIETQVIRHSKAIIDLLAERDVADTDRKVAEKSKGDARVALDKLMETTLDAFQGEINNWLKHFGAPFSITQLKASYLGGGAPRSDYAIDLRGVPIPVGKKSANGLSFQTVLSDGDKRTLALAFFLAKLFNSPESASAVVVMDDVFTSLDRHRKTQTSVALTEIGNRCGQVIVLGHDAYFLRDVRRRVVEKKVGDVLSLEIQRGAGNFSVIGEVDLDELCASPYFKRYRLVEEYLSGNGGIDLLNVAVALRPLVEGHLHRCFPGKLKEGETFGSMLQQVKDAKESNPLVVLQHLVPSLQTFNDFAGAYHHDTSGRVPRQDVSDGELQTFATNALQFIRTGRL